MAVVALVAIAAAAGAGYLIGASGGAGDCDNVTARYVGHCLAVRVDVARLIDQLEAPADSPTARSLRDAAHLRTADLWPWLARCSAEPSAIERAFKERDISGDPKAAAAVLRRAVEYVPRDRSADWSFLQAPP